MRDSVMISLRINRQLLEQIDSLVEAMVVDPKLTPSGVVTRADVLRLLLVRGVEDFSSSGAQNDPIITPRV